MIDTIRSDYLKSWIVTTRPKTLILSVFPFLIGTVIAMGKTARIDWFLMFVAMLSAFFIQIGTNLINDVYDFKNKADKSTRLGPKRGIQSGSLTSSEVFLAALASFAIALIFAVPLVLKGGFVICLVLVTSVACGFLYTAGPKPLAYNGLGELFVVIFFGLVSTSCAFYFQTGYLDLEIMWVGLSLGALSSNPIAINNLRDLEEDKKVDKNTLAVTFGKTFAKIEITFLLLIPFLLLCFFENNLARLGFIALPFALIIVKNIWQNEPSERYNFFLSQSILLYTLFSLFLLAGFLL